MSSPSERESVDDIKVELEKLKSSYNLLLDERNRAFVELSSLGEALAECQRGRVELESALKRIRTSEPSTTFSEATVNRMSFLEKEVESLSKISSELERLLLGSMVQELGIREKIRDFILSRGSPRCRILLLASERGSVDAREIIRFTGLDQLTVDQAIRALNDEHAIEIHGSLLMIPGRMKLPEIDDWRALPTDNLFDQVAQYCNLIRDPETASQAIQALRDILILRVKARNLIFEMGKEIQQLKKGIWNPQQLQIMIRDWKFRAKE